MKNNANRLRGYALGAGALMLFASSTGSAQYATSVQSFTGAKANWPTATISPGVPSAAVPYVPYKIVGGGARTNWTTFGNLLTQSSPGAPGQNAWIGAGKDHSVPEPTTLTVFGIALTDPNDDWEVGVFPNTSAMAPHPVVTATLPPDFTLTGGGCTVNWLTSAPAPAGNLLTASFPAISLAGVATWECRSKDHSVPDPSTVTAYVIGIRPKKAGLLVPHVRITQATSVAGAHPSVAVEGLFGWWVTGGGALALPGDPNGAGQLLTGSFPTTPAGSDVPNGWFASSKDHSVPSPGRITAYAVNVTFSPPAPTPTPTPPPTPPALTTPPPPTSVGAVTTLAITRLSPAGGQAGDPVSIVGSGFGEAGGTVHFVFGATDYGAIVNAWHDTQIDTYLPPVSGSATLTTPNRVGYFYVVRNPDQARSPMAGFLVVNPLL